MSDFINTIDQLGDEVVTNLLIDRTITEFKDNVFINLASYYFAGCSKLETVNFPNVVKIGENAFSNCSALVTVDFPSATEVASYAFSKCSALTTIDLPNASRIRDNVFSGCTNLTTINLPNVTIIDSSAFSSLVNLRVINLPKVTSITSSMFSYCCSLTAVILRSETMATLSSTSAFNSCFHILGTTNSTYNPTGAKDGYIYVPKALLSDDDATKDYRRATNWSTYASQFRALEDYTIDGTITGELDPNKVNPSLTRAYIDKSITEISIDVTNVYNRALFQCLNLKTVDFPNATSIDDYAFCGCPALTTVDLPLVTSIGYGAFHSCSTLTTLDLPLVTSIGNSAFYNCSSLTTLILRSETMATLIQTNAFYNTQIANAAGYIYVPRALVDSYKAATNWSVFANQFRAIEDYPDICGGA